MPTLPPAIQDFIAHGGGLASDALYAHWDDRGDETAARATAVGPAAIGELLERHGPRRLAPLVFVGEGADCFIEGRMTGVRDATFAASVQLDGDGSIGRWLSFHCAPVEGPVTPGSPGLPVRTEARPVLDRYFASLAAGELVAAADCFSWDCLYSHPPYRPGTPRAEFRGRADLLAGFAGVRGASSARPVIVRSVQRGAECFVEGVVEGIADGGSFVSSVTLDPLGLIRRYVAFYCAPRIRRR